MSNQASVLDTKVKQLERELAAKEKQISTQAEKFKQASMSQAASMTQKLNGMNNKWAGSS